MLHPKYLLVLGVLTCVLLYFKSYWLWYLGIGALAISIFVPKMLIADERNVVLVSALCVAIVLFIGFKMDDFLFERNKIYSQVFCGKLLKKQRLHRVLPKSRHSKYYQFTIQSENGSQKSFEQSSFEYSKQDQVCVTYIPSEQSIGFRQDRIVEIKKRE